MSWHLWTSDTAALCFLGEIRRQSGGAQFIHRFQARIQEFQHQTNALHQLYLKVGEAKYNEFMKLLDGINKSSATEAVSMIKFFTSATSCLFAQQHKQIQ